MNDRADPFRSVARELLCVLADEGRAMSLRELEASGRMEPDDVAGQLSVARVAGFVRSVPTAGGPTEPCYQPTTLGWMIARRSSRALAAAHELRGLGDDRWAA